jgi:hypothetical protein
MPRRRGIAFAATTLAVAAAVTFGGCGHFIGDPCNSNVDCSPAGDRFCDKSALGGYCTIEGCDVNTCPDFEPCVRFFTPVCTESCDAAHPCSPDARCIADVTNAGGVMSRCDPSAFMSATGGHCAPETSERRWCQHHCANDGDCRPGFVCRSTVNGGTPTAPVLPGAFAVPTVSNPEGDPASFCVQSG